MNNPVLYIVILFLVLLLSGCSVAVVEINIYEPCPDFKDWCDWEEPEPYAHEYYPDLGKGGLKIK